MIGCVNDAPAPVLEIVSGADVTTEVSVVGKASDVRAPAAPGPGDGAEPADETTEVSSVGNRGGALPDRRGRFFGASDGRRLGILLEAPTHP